VQLVDTTLQGLAWQVLGSRITQRMSSIRPGTRTASQLLHVRKAQYNFRELRNWSRVAEQILDRENGAVFVDADEQRNRVEIGVSDVTTWTRVYSELLSRGVPESALHGGVTPRTRLTSQDLHSKVRPISAGLQVENDSGYSQRVYCGLGANTIDPYSGSVAFVTNAHCTHLFGSVSVSDLFYQNDSPYTEVGIEHWDDSPWQYTSDCSNYRYYHPSGVCRYSDMAVVDYLPDVGSSLDSVDFGYITRTTYRGSGVGIVGSLVIDSANRHFEIIGPYYTIPTGIYLDRMGRTSGWTYHNTSSACTTEYVNSATPPRKLWCQYRTGGGAQDGDSGSPFFSVVDCAPGQPTRADGTACVKFAGLHWGTNPDGRSLFSSITGMQTDFGYALLMRPTDWPH
jgi:hypothetical protein